VTNIVVRVKGRYEVSEAPFSRSYSGHSAYVTLECDRGETLTLSSASPTSSCRCDTNHSVIVQELQERERRLQDEVAHPWRYATEEQVQQYLREESALLEGLPWRYNNVT
jgi:hypothetical protein